ncbi:helix-turn-helix domain-containing protein [Mesorhizobium sp. 2RAF21]|uniref:helix-turn-helix domain-containing protein n=1 Tax=Mesorhizobium sp. 2RAF21 TaxID=3232995 RepID=UPI003F978B5A
MSELADRIKEAADEVGGLNKLAELIGAPRRSLGNWLRGTKPKPKVLQGIADVAEVNLAWLISGLGEKFAREKLDRIAQEERQRREFDAILSHGMRAVDQHRRELDPLYDMEIRARAPRVDVVLLERMARLVEEVHKDVGIRITPAKISAEAGVLYNELMARLFNQSDAEEIEAILPQLRHFLRKRLEQATAEPGTGKRSA